MEREAAVGGQPRLTAFRLSQLGCKTSKWVHTCCNCPLERASAEAARALTRRNGIFRLFARFEHLLQVITWNRSREQIALQIRAP